MKAVRVHAYHEDPKIDDIPEPTLQGPLDVIVKIGGAGVCRTDLHIVNGDWAEAMNPDLPYVIGHENAGWVHEIGEGVTNVAVGDTVILHPQPSCGLCLACRRRPRHAVRERLLPRPEQQRRRHGRVPAHHRPGLRQARPRHQPRRRRRAGRRRHHRLPRGAQGRAAPLPGHHRRRAGRGRAWATSASRRSRRSPARASSSSTATPTPSRWPSRSAPTRPWSPTAATSTPSRT